MDIYQYCDLVLQKERVAALEQEHLVKQEEVDRSRRALELAKVTVEELKQRLLTAEQAASSAEMRAISLSNELENVRSELRIQAHVGEAKGDGSDSAVVAKYRAEAVSHMIHPQ
jgi:multidrug resistance efflux pump